LTYATFADAFGWTPSQVDELPAWLEPILIPVTNVLREARDGGG
jgi:hypothetical protein